MKNIKNIWKENKRKALLYIGIGFIIVLVIIITIILLLKIFKKYDYPAIEKMMITSTEKYLKEHKDELPSLEKPSITIPASTLITNKYMKDFSKLSKDTGCIGEVTVSFLKNNFRYEPKLTCTNYETKSLFANILEYEEIKTTGNGLYDLYDFYTYRGEFVSNYLSFAGFSWRILKFNEEMMYLILADTVNSKTTYVYDDRYNESINSNRGRNNFESSRINQSLNEIYTNDFTSYHKYILPMDACTHVRSKFDRDNSGYIECFTTYETYMALPAVYDYMNASLDERCTTSDSLNCSNYNYLAKTKRNWWLLNGTNENSYQVYYSSTSGKLGLDSANGKKDIRPVIALPSTLIYKNGVGTAEKPFTFYEY